MKTSSWKSWVAGMLMWLALAAMAPAANTWYVSVTNGSDSNGGTGWLDAKQTIQAALDLAVSNDTVLVSNGIYNVGGRAGYPGGTALTNRVAVTNAIILLAVSTNPAATIIEGAADPATTNGNAAVRGVYLSSAGARLSGFTIRGGYSRDIRNAADGYGAGIYCQSATAVITNCIVEQSCAKGSGGGVYQGTVYTSTIRNNTADGVTALPYDYGGGGVFDVVAYDCTISGNSVIGTHSGGGGYYGTYRRCMISSNTGWRGGGVYRGTLYDCTLITNYGSYHGGGTYISTNYTCTFLNNYGTKGGSVYSGLATNCTFVGNRAGGSEGDGGGAAYGGNIYNSVMISNTVYGDAGSWKQGGAARNATLANCLVVANSGQQGTLYACRADNCTIASNSTVNRAAVYSNSIAYNCLIYANNNGGAQLSLLVNCTVVSNRSATYSGVADCQLTNSIVYLNSPANYNAGCTFDHSCTTPDPGAGLGNITANPVFINTNTSNFRIANVSPCINAGTNGPWCDPPATDLDGKRRIVSGVADIGAYEFLPSGSVIRVQ